MNKTKLIYAVDKNSYSKKDHIGVRNKIDMQIAVMKKNGIEAFIQEYTWEDGLPTIRVEDNTDVLYFRTIGPSFRLAMMLRRMKQSNPNLRIIMEIPTYPFDGEDNNWKSIKTRLNEYIGTMLWRICLDRIVIISLDYDGYSLFGVRTIHMNNGIDFDAFNPVRIDSMESIDIIAVSGCYFWHGYDLLIEGLHDYYAEGENKRDINLHLVGEGDCLEQYRELADQFGLAEQHVIFHGSLTGQALEEVYNKCNMAADSFGAFRKGIFKACSLKSREYVAHGLPIISSVGFDFDNDITKKYLCVLEYGEKPVDVDSIVRFFDETYTDENTVNSIPTNIRDTFRPYCDINSTYKNVIEYIVNGKG